MRPFWICSKLTGSRPRADTQSCLRAARKVHFGSVHSAGGHEPPMAAKLGTSGLGSVADVRAGATYAISCLAAAENITTPPVITATSRIAVWMCTGMRSTKA